MPTFDLVIRGRRIVFADRIAPASIHVRNGRIEAIKAFSEVSDDPLVEADDESIVMPGLVDSHVHVNEPGRTDWEGFATATRAAAAGGVTTIVDMPLNSIPATTTRENLQTKLNAASGQLYVDAAFWGGVIPGNKVELPLLWDAGVVGFKCFLIHSGVEEFPNVNEDDLREAMPVLALLGATLIVHAEVPGPVEAACCQFANEPATSYQTFLQSRPRLAEDEAVRLMIRLSLETGCRVHIVHHSSANSLAALRAAKASGAPITVETCPHYLHFAAEEIPDGATEYKCCPPVRERENREQLWAALRDGTIDMVVSDHSPCPPEMKLRERGDFMNAWGGISSLQLRLPVMWTEALTRNFDLLMLTEWLCRAPARQVGLEGRKGAIAVGADADFVIWNPNREFVVEPEMIHHRHKLTPYAGEILRGTVQKTFLRGQMVYHDGEFNPGPCGIILRRAEKQKI